MESQLVATSRRSAESLGDGRTEEDHGFGRFNGMAAEGFVPEGSRSCKKEERG